MNTAKHGGYCNATPDNCVRIVESAKFFPDIKYFLESAPGIDKSTGSCDFKVTELLYNVYDLAIGVPKSKAYSFRKIGMNVEEAMNEIEKTFGNNIRGLGIKNTNVAEIRKTMQELLTREATVPEFVRLGEYFQGKIIAEALDATFIPSDKVIFMDENGGALGSRTITALKDLKNIAGRVVVEAFSANSGTYDNPIIRLFPRGGADYSASIVGVGVNSHRIYNFNDVPGILFVDPRLLPEAKRSTIPIIRNPTFQEGRELSYSGASVLQEETLVPPMRAGIEVNVRGILDFNDEGTLIGKNSYTNGVVKGLAVKDGFVVINAYKPGASNEIGFVWPFLGIFAENGISVNHIPTNVDSASVVFHKSEFDKQDSKSLEYIISQLKDRISPESIDTSEMSLIAVVGEGIRYNPRIDAAVATALADQNIVIRMTEKSPYLNNIIIGVDQDKVLPAVNSLYDVLRPKN